MMIRITKSAPILITSLAITLSGCVSTPYTNQASEITSLADVSAVFYKVKPGDQLGRIALTLTGDVANWRSIADYNGIADPRALSTGQTIRIPAALLGIGEPLNIDSADAALNETVKATNNTQSDLPVKTSNGVRVARGAEPDRSETVEVDVSPVNVNRDFELVRWESRDLLNSESARFDSPAPQIRVSGTYYPKGVYEQPADYSRLVRRVTPGTVFELDIVVNDWYKILIDDTVGYIRKIDGALVE